MDRTAWAEPLVRTLRLDTQPVAVSVGGPPDPEAAAGSKLSVCQAIERAARGETCVITGDTCGCPGGMVSLGLGQTPAAAREKLVEFLVEREKVYCSRVAMHRGRQTVPPPVGVGGQYTFAPLATAATRPDLVLFVGKPGSLHVLIELASYWDGGSLEAELAGPACRTGVAYSLVTGEVGLSLFDFGARRLAGFADDLLLVSVPFGRMLGIMQAIDEGVGSGRVKDRAGMERDIDGLGRVEPV